MKINKSEDDINELKKIKEKFNHQNTKIIEIENELNEKKSNIEILEKNIKKKKIVN